MHVKRIKNNEIEKFFYESPYNTNNFLFQNNLNPFYDENDKEDFYFSKLNKNINIDNEIQNLFNEKIESTNEESDTNEESKENTRNVQSK